MKETKREIRRRRAYQLGIYPLMVAREIGAITKEEFKEQHRELIKSLDEIEESSR